MDPSAASSQGASRPRRQPKYKITWWMRLRSRLYCFRSPLNLRGSITRLRHHNRWPYLALLRLCLPTVSLSWSYALPQPLSPLNLVDDPWLCWTKRCKADLKNMQTIPFWRSRDTPLRSLYRLYETVMGGEEMLPVVGYETEYFFFQSRSAWQLHRVPDPRDPDPIRYAILACILESLVFAFNMRLRVGLRRDRNHIPPTAEGYAPFEPVRDLPPWTSRVPAIDKQYLRDVMPERVLDSFGNLVLHEHYEEGDGSDIFLKRNIIASEHKFWTI